MKTRSPIQRILVITTLVVALAVVVTATFRAQAQRQDDMKAEASSEGATLGTGVFSLLPGQTVCVAAVNVGGKEIPLQLYVTPVSEQGKRSVSILCDATPAPGDAAFETFTNANQTRMLMYVQVRVRDNPNNINELVPSVEIIDGTSNLPAELLSGGDFTAFRPIWVPS